MSNQYYNEGGTPAQSSPGTSLVVRAEFAAIRSAFDKLPALLGNDNKIVTVNSSGTALTIAGVYGTAASVNIGTGTGQLPTLIAPNMLPALDGSQLINLQVNQGGVIDIAHGGTGAATLGGAQTNLGITLKADAANAVLTGAPIATTAVTGDNSVRVATTAFVQATMAATGSFAPSNAAPLVNGVANSGVGALGSRADHVHPSDTSRAPIASPVFTGDPQAPTPATADNDTSIATTAYVKASLLADRPFSATNPVINGTATPGAAASVSRGDHVHPTDSTRAPIASPVFTGDPQAPTPATSDNDTSIATTAYVKACLALAPTGILASNVTPLMNGSASAGVGVDGSRYDHVHPTDTSRAPVASPTFTGTVGGISAMMIVSSAVGGVAATNVQAAIQELDLEKATIASPVFTGDPQAPTPANSDSDTSLATTAFVKSVIQNQTAKAYTTSGTATAFTLTPSPAIAANAANQEFQVKFHLAAGLNPQLSVSGQTALNLKYYDSTGAKQFVTAAQVPANLISNVVNDGTDFVVLDPVVAALVPAGTIIDYAGSTPPAGYLTCPLSLTYISATTYSALAFAIGTTWGNGGSVVAAGSFIIGNTYVIKTLGTTNFTLIGAASNTVGLTFTATDIGSGSGTANSQIALPWFAANYTAVQANANVGSTSTGQILDHTHLSFNQAGGVGAAGAAFGQPGQSGAVTGAAAGAANLAAGVRVLKCIKY